MPLSPLAIVELLLIGCGAGLLSGLLGIGGGMVMVPFVAFLLGKQGIPPDSTVKMAVATSLATICFTSMSSMRAHHRRGAVRWDVAKLLAPGILAGSLLGAQVAVALPAKVLGVFFGCFVAFSATQMLLGRKPQAARSLPGRAGTLSFGALIGVVSAIVGAGGAFMSVPFMTWCNIRIHEAVATSSALGFPIAVAGTLGYIWAGRDLPPMPGAFGYLYVPGLVVISIASVSLAPLGARLAHSMDIQPLRRLFAFVLYALALYFLLR